MEVFQTSLKRLFRFKLSFFLSITCVSIISYPSHANPLNPLTNNKFNDKEQSFSWEFTWNRPLTTNAPDQLFPDRNLKDENGQNQDEGKEQWSVFFELADIFPPEKPGSSQLTVKGQHMVKVEDTDAPKGGMFQKSVKTSDINFDIQKNVFKTLFTEEVEHIHNRGNHKDSYQLNYMVLNNGHIYFQFIGVHIGDHIKTPELSSPLSLLALSTLGAASTLKRKLKPSKSNEKETTKVG
jgi:hypothetical protein